MGGTGFPVPLNAWGDFTAPHGAKRHFLNGNNKEGRSRRETKKTNRKQWEYKNAGKK